jgi:DNA-binding NtrC family response regulator
MVTAPGKLSWEEADMVDRIKVLVACSDPESRQTLSTFLSQCGLDPVFSTTVREARAILARQSIPLVICSADLVDGSFRDVLRAAGTGDARVPVVVASRRDDTAEYLEAMQLGAFDFIACPYKRSEVEWIVSHVLRRTAAAA